MTPAAREAWAMLWWMAKLLLGACVAAGLVVGIVALACALHVCWAGAMAVLIATLAAMWYGVYRSRVRQ